MALDNERMACRCRRQAIGYGSSVSGFPAIDRQPCRQGCRIRPYPFRPAPPIDRIREPIFLATGFSRLLNCAHAECPSRRKTRWDLYWFFWIPGLIRFCLRSRPVTIKSGLDRAFWLNIEEIGHCTDEFVGALCIGIELQHRTISEFDGKATPYRLVR